VPDSTLSGCNGQAENEQCFTSANDALQESRFIVHSREEYMLLLEQALSTDQFRKRNHMADRDKEGAMLFAVKLLGLRSHSRDELERKLRKKGYDVSCIEAVMEKLTLQGLIDDRVFGAEFIQSRSRRKPAGKLRMRSELRKKGVSDTIITTLVSAMNSRELCMKAAEKKIRSLHARSGADKKKRLEQFLHNRGFEWQDIQPVVKSLLEAGGAGPDDQDLPQQESP